ncbi:hypothetical protein [Noviherbaspirillum aridicola]|uniref:Uncharacterized protein n=1 Tax=Noviherbaspirillum aridicola TaxID=2849687 RepID=A0ABQ4Q248_9BURK|nr:hypothetical protein [Noviherbaspirillum aridicola]GIZ51111.1 hypothetical protein NCCP691_11250 [Noviherbaspirillum aridicola]
MKRSNDVYFITLIDLLVQIIFLGLLLYVLAKAVQERDDKRRADEKEATAALLKASGVSSITELTDELTKLAPLKELKGTADFISRAGGAAEVKKAAELVAQAGGVENLSTKLAEAQAATSVVSAAGGIEKVAAIVKKHEEGSGKPPCLYTESGTKKVARPVAIVLADDSSITFQGLTSDLASVLGLLGKQYDAVERLSFAEFSATFSPLLRLKPECRYTLRFIEKTDLVHAREAARATFNLSIRRSN